MMFSGTAGSGTHGGVTSDWATYFTMNNTSSRGWIFRRVGSGNSASISAGGLAQFDNSVRSPIFYDSNNTGYYLNPASGNTGQALKINGIINRDGFSTSGNGDNNILLRAQDYTHWIWQTASTWGLMWAGNNNPRNSYWSSSNPNELVFIGSGNTRASIDLDNGNAYFAGEVRGTIFKDSNDTGYYIDPNSTSQVARLRGKIVIGPNNSWGDYIQIGGNGREFTNNTRYASVVTTDGNLHLDAAFEIVLI